MFRFTDRQPTEINEINNEVIVLVDKGILVINTQPN